ncbi:MAG TPA: GAF domain-containing sensor histidine kinase [Polyangia bacterium]|jgi:signal transduction histidine kinase|nr:GAF domain-containing sensor histidine kinase [Polyangia bacterium]
MQRLTVAALLRLSAAGANENGAWLEEILRIDSEILETQRVGYWSFLDDPPGLFCELGFVAPAGLFERGAILSESASPSYFDHIRKLQLVAADDARNDPRTRDLGTYLEALNIGAMLDAPVCRKGRPVGVLCHEQVGATRRWNEDDQAFALAVSQAVAASLESRARLLSEEAERQATFLSSIARDLAEPLDLERIGEMAARRALPILGDVATLDLYEAGIRRFRATAHSTPERQRLGEEWKRRHPRTMDRQALIERVIREKQSVILPTIAPEALATFDLPGVTEMLTTFGIRSAMAVPLQIRGRLTGGLSFFNASRSYTQDDLRFAETYARQIGGILENARLYQQAQDAIRVRDEFVALASHELRTPLAGLLASAEGIVRLIQKSEPPGGAIRRLGEIVARQVEQFGRLTERILAASQLVERPTLAPEAFDLAELVRQVAHGFDGLAARAGSPVIVRAEAPAVGRWDRRRLGQVVSNLLGNAIKFGEGRPIEVTISSHDDVACLAVKDHGIGIPADQLGDLFQRYQRAVPARHFGGLGLGLYLVRVIVEAHGGKVQAESKPGEGTTFTVELPQPAASAVPT